MNNALKISGPDAEKFLQGQVTCNVALLQENVPQWCALCNRKGRVVASFPLIKKSDYFLMILSEPMVEIVQKILGKYAKFSKVNLDNMGRVDAPPLQIDNMITEETTEQFTPHKLNYHLIPGMIDFNKGCYTGQEIIARVHYRSKGRKE